ncbi:hypothetical protein ACNE9Y_31565 [Pseudomonas sp. NY11226]|uniref:hypothetical protein n=1 Tax=Pseudomonas sp. NY11226 TaxID=3400362 RepID=UPI0018C666C4|nr:hypothetical protein [Pseudomonas aeruginosa]
MKKINKAFYWNMLMFVPFSLCIILLALFGYVLIIDSIPNLIMWVTGSDSVDATYWFLLSIVVVGVITKINHHVTKHIATRWTIKCNEESSEVIASKKLTRGKNEMDI